MLSSKMMQTLYAAHIFSPVSTVEFHFWDQGGLLVDDEAGVILDVGKYDEVYNRVRNSDVFFEQNNDYITDYILPGFVDTHIHYPQANLLVAPGMSLLEWLDKSIFPGEIRMQDPDHAQKVASFLLQSMLAAGTTTALIYGVTYLEAMHILCAEAENLGFRAHPGKMLMDKDAPAELLDESAEAGYKESNEFIERWQDRGNIRPSIALRFALTSTPEQMRLTAKLLDEHPDLAFQTHLNENKSEIDAVLTQNPDCHTYLSVYDKYDLVREQSVYGHCVHMRDIEIEALRSANASIAHCPCSNLYLGSGIVDLASLEGLKIGLGSDVGAGYTYSILENAKTMHVLQKLNENYIESAELFYMATLGGAKVLRVDTEIGSLDVGKKADFTVLSSARYNEVLSDLISSATTPEEKLHKLILLHNANCVRATFIDGESKYLK